ncbi:hypothetical protein D3C86_2251780 [compost metagenome]
MLVGPQHRDGSRHFGLAVNLRESHLGQFLHHPAQQGFRDRRCAVTQVLEQGQVQLGETR